MKSCNNPLCPETNPQPLANFFKDKRSKDGLMGKCKTCKQAKTMAWRAANQDSYNKGARDWRAKNVVKDRWYNTKRSLKNTYGLSVEDYQNMLIEQNHVCAICGGEEGRSRRGIRMRLCVDHDHDTGKIRGLLCSDCNAGLGYFMDKRILCIKGALYLKKHK